jgi:hypothetical protein
MGKRQRRPQICSADKASGSGGLAKAQAANQTFQKFQKRSQLASTLLFTEHILDRVSRIAVQTNKR